MKTVIIYGSMTGSTEAVANDLGAAFDDAIVISAATATEQDVQDCALLILGASTWGMGDLQDDMADFLVQLADWKLNAEFGAVFGLGDQFGYGDSYVDGMADMAEALEGKELKLAGTWPVAGYGHSSSRAQRGDHFIGLALDQDNESEKTMSRVSNWIAQLKKETEA